MMPFSSIMINKDKISFFDRSSNVSPTKESSPDTSGSRFVPNFILFKVKDQRYANYLDKVYLTLTVRPRSFRDEGGRLRNGN